MKRHPIESSRPPIANAAVERPPSIDHEEIGHDALWQERTAFENFLTHIDAQGERRPPTEEEKTRMDASLECLGKLFEGLDVHWQLDGAMNISLYQHEATGYIGIHKDLDLSFDADELDALEAALLPRGYAFFLSIKNDSTNPMSNVTMKRVHAAEFRHAAETDSANAHPMLCAIDARGMIRSNTALGMVDVHIVKRDHGAPIVHGAHLPAEWYEPKSFAFHDTHINLSHPAKVAYFKLHGDRVYDMTDVHHLANQGLLSLHDCDTMRELLHQEAQEKQSRAEQILTSTAQRIVDPISRATGVPEILEIFSADSDIAPRASKVSAELRRVAETILALPERTADAIFTTFMDVFGEFLVMDQEMERLAQLETWVRATYETWPGREDGKESENLQLLHALETSGEYVFHGSPNGAISMLELRQAFDHASGKAKEDGPPAVVASPYADIAIFRALVHEDSTRFGTDNSGPHFAATAQAMHGARTQGVGYVYVLRRDQFAPKTNHADEMDWRAHTPQRPAHVIPVYFRDLPTSILKLEGRDQEKPARSMESGTMEYDS